MRRKILSAILIGFLVFSTVCATGCIDLEDVDYPIIEIRMDR